MCCLVLILILIREKSAIVNVDWFERSEGRGKNECGKGTRVRRGSRRREIKIN